MSVLQSETPAGRSLSPLPDYLAPFFADIHVHTDYVILVYSQAKQSDNSAMARPGFGPDVLDESLPMFHFFSQRPLHAYFRAPGGQSAKAGLFLCGVMSPFFFLEKLSSLLVLCGVNRISSFPQITARGVYLNKQSGNNNAFSIMMLLLVGSSACSLAYLNSRKRWNVVESLSCRFCFPLWNSL